MKTFPRFSHLDPSSLPLSVLSHGCLSACHREALYDSSQEQLWVISVFISVQWLEAHLYLYEVAEPWLRERLGDELETLQRIPHNDSQQFVDLMLSRFPVVEVFLFCVCSSVKLHPRVFAALQGQASAVQQQQDDEIELLQRSVERLDAGSVVTPTESPSPGPSPAYENMGAGALLSRSFDNAVLSEGPGPAPAGKYLTPPLHTGTGGARHGSFLGKGSLKDASWRVRATQSYSSNLVNRGKSLVPPEHDPLRRAGGGSGGGGGAGNGGGSGGSGDGGGVGGGVIDRVVRCESRSGWLEKLKGMPSNSLFESGCTASPGVREDELRWKRRWVVVADGKLSWYCDSDARDMRGCVPLYLVSSVSTHPELGSAAFGIRCGSLVRFIFRAPLEKEMTPWLWTMQRWLASTMHKQGRNVLLKGNILSVGRWWKKLHWVKDKKRSLESFTDTIQRESELSVIGKCEVSFDRVRPHPTRDGPFLIASVALTKGQRPTMEDGHIACPEIAAVRQWGFSVQPAKPVALFAVFDGHGGPEASLFCVENFPPILASVCPSLSSLDLRNPTDQEALKEALKKAFVRLDEAFLEVALDDLLPQPSLAGCTACVVLVCEQGYVVANLGDSRVALCRNGTAIHWTVDHKPSDPAERARILEAGGWITENKELDVSKLWRLNPHLVQEDFIPSNVGEEIGFITSYRVLGELSVSRAIGDAEAKGSLKHEFWGDRATFRDDLISCVPDVLIWNRDATALHEFLLLACDGFWDVFETQEAATFCRERMKWHSKNVQPLSRSVESPTQNSPTILHAEVHKAAEDLVHEALRRGSLGEAVMIFFFFFCAVVGLTSD